MYHNFLSELICRTCLRLENEVDMLKLFHLIFIISLLSLYGLIRQRTNYNQKCSRRMKTVILT